MKRAILVRRCKHCGIDISDMSESARFCGAACRMVVQRLKNKGFVRFGVISCRDSHYDDAMRILVNDKEYEYSTFKRIPSDSNRAKNINEYITYKRSLK